MPESQRFSGLQFRQNVDHMVDRALVAMRLEDGIAKAVKAYTSKNCTTM